MKLNATTLYIILFFVMFFAHLGIWQYFEIGFDTTFIKYYLFLTLLFVTVITIISIVKNIYPNYIGFAFMGLVMFKLMIMFLVMNKLHLSEVPNYKLHFIIPYLISLVLETLYSVKLIQIEEKNKTEKQENLTTDSEE